MSVRQSMSVLEAPIVRLERSVSKPKALTVFLGDTALKAGKNGKEFKYSPIKQSNQQRDYSFERKKAAEVLIGNQGEKFDSEKLWREIHGYDCEFELPVIQKVQSWLSRIEADEAFIFKVDKLGRGAVECSIYPEFDITLSYDNSFEQE